MNKEQRDTIRERVAESPQESGFSRGNWTGKLVARFIRDKFAVSYTHDGALKLTHRLGFTVRTARSIPYNSATPEGQRTYIGKAKVTIAEWGRENRRVLVIDAATIQDSPSSKRGLRLKGGRDTVQVNFSRKSTHILGALGNGTLDIEFHENLKAGSYISLVESMRKK